nr:RNA polymerase sigma factor [Clostridium sp. Cult3]
MVYKKYNREFIAYAKSITRNEDRALDLVQEAYVSALEREDIFIAMNEYQIKGWFFRVIKNKNIDNIRRENRVLLLEKDEILGTVENFEEEIAIKDLLDKLPKKNREVVNLRYNMLLNSREIGEILGIPASTVRSWLSASMKMLKNNL